MDYSKELKFAREFVQKAGEVMSKHFGIDLETAWKQDQTPLTIADTTINSMLISNVKEKFVDDGVLGEEESYGLSSERLWVIDPIDGTMPYSNGVPTSTCSLALVVDGQPVVAAVFDPATKRTYSASKGMGSYLNGKQVKVNDQSTFNSQTFIDIDGRNELHGYSTGEILNLLMQKGARVTKSYSVIFNSMPIVYGKQAATIGVIEYPWDGAAIALLVTEAGGTVTDLAGNQRDWSKEGLGFIASNGVIHDQLVQFMSLNSK